MSAILLIDLSAIAHQTWHLKSSDPNPDATSITIVERVRALASGQPHVGLCLDSPPYFRSEIDPAYKQNRKTEDRAPLYHQLAIALDTLKADGFPTFAAKGFEADDVIATIAAKVAGDVLIASSDKDLMQLVSDRVRIKSLTTGDLIDPDYVLKATDKDGKVKIGVRPDQMVDFLSLVGDSSDNIKGAEKVGPIGARGLLGEFGSIDGLREAFKGATFTLTPNLRSRLEEFLTRADTVRSLIRLRTDAPIDIAPLLAERVPAAGDAVVFDDDPTTFIGFGHADPDLAAAHADAAAQSLVPADVQAAPSQDILDDLRDVFRTTPAGERAFAAAERSGTPVPVVTAANGDMVDAITGEVLKQAAPAHAGAFAERAAQAGNSTGPAVAEPATLQQQHSRLVDSVAEYQERKDAEREANAADRAAGRSVVRDDALQGQQGRGPADAAGSRIPDGADRVRRDGPDRGDRGQGAAVEVMPAVAYERQLEPRSLGEAYKLATSMFQARLFSAYGNADAVLSTVLAGREFGMPAMASLRAIHIIDNKPVFAADTIRALVLRSGAAEYFRCTERTNERATFVTKRNGEPEMSLSFSIDDAKLAWSKSAEAWEKSGWKKNPADMLVARAGAKLARLVYPDVVHGVYSREEME